MGEDSTSSGTTESRRFLSPGVMGGVARARFLLYDFSHSLYGCNSNDEYLSIDSCEVGLLVAVTTEARMSRDDGLGEDAADSTVVVIFFKIDL